MNVKLTIQRFLLASALSALVFVALAVCLPRKRRVTVTFNYDFSLSHACSPASTADCVKQFNVYDLTAKKRMKLFSIPVPADADGFVNGITGTSPPLRLPAGEQILVVTAQAADGSESDFDACTTRIRVKP